VSQDQRQKFWILEAEYQSLGEIKDELTAGRPLVGNMLFTEQGEPGYFIVTDREEVLIMPSSVKYVKAPRQRYIE
jgi:hypothetical protein